MSGRPHFGPVHPDSWTSSSFRALQVQRVRFVYLFYVPWFGFAFQGVFLVRSLTFFLFALLFFLTSVAYLALENRQQEFRLPTRYVFASQR